MLCGTGFVVKVSCFWRACHLYAIQGDTPRPGIPTPRPEDLTGGARYGDGLTWRVCSCGEWGDHVCDYPNVPVTGLGASIADFTHPGLSDGSSHLGRSLLPFVAHRSS